MTNTKDVIVKLKEVREEKNLSFDKILALMEENGDYLSKSTLSRVFSEGSEEMSFRYEETIRPIANALLDIENEEDYDDVETKAYKSILKLKMGVIEENSRQIALLKEELGKEKEKYHDKLAAETAKFQNSLDFAMHQIELKDKRIDQLMNDNSKLINHILDCPYRKDCGNES